MHGTAKIPDPPSWLK